MDNRVGQEERREVKGGGGHKWESLEKVVETGDCTHTDLVQLLFLLAMWPTARQRQQLT